MKQKNYVRKCNKDPQIFKFENKNFPTPLMLLNKLEAITCTLVNYVISLVYVHSQSLLEQKLNIICFSVMQYVQSRIVIINMRVETMSVVKVLGRKVSMEEAGIVRIQIVKGKCKKYVIRRDTMSAEMTNTGNREIR